VEWGKVFNSGREWIVRVVGGEGSGGGESGTVESVQGEWNGFRDKKP
jgi:hypothetical protein